MTRPEEQLVTQPEDQLAEVLATATTLLAENLGTDVRLDEPRVLKRGRRSTTIRVSLDEPVYGRQSLLIRILERDLAQGFSDWASLEFLTGSDAPAPRFIAGSAPQGLLLVEDLGAGSTLEELLTATDEQAVLEALDLLGRAMGRLNSIGGKNPVAQIFEHDGPGSGLDGSWAATGSSVGDARFQLLRQGLPEWQGCGRQADAQRWRAGLPRVAVWFAELSVPMPASWTAACEELLSVYLEPATLTFSHGDPAPSNNLFTETGCFLVDFEYGGFRHYLYDLSAWNVLCPLPQAHLARLVNGFRATFPAIEDARFERDWQLLCTYRSVAMLSWLSPAVIGEDGPWALHWSCRRAAAVAMDRLASSARQLADCQSGSHGIDENTRSQSWDEVAESAAHLLLSLQQRLPELTEIDEILPSWPALS